MFQFTEQERQRFVKHFARLLRLAREEADYTSQAAGARVTNISRERLKLHESGEQEPKLSDLVAYAIAYNKPLEYFFSGLPSARLQLTRDCQRVGRAICSPPLTSSTPKSCDYGSGFPLR